MARVVIVGGGVAGLSAGIAAALAGHCVTVCEKNKKAGGNLIGWNREGYHIDNCVHWLTGTNPKTKLYKIWRTLGVLDRLETYQPETLYTVEKEGKSLSLYSSLEKTEKSMLAASRGDDAEIRSLIRAVRAMNVISGTESPSLTSVGHFLSLAKYVRLTARELSERFRAPVLKSFIGSFFGEDFGAIALINVFSTFTSGNGALPRGGSSAMAEAMAARLAECGGRLLTESEVLRVDREGGRVTRVHTPRRAVDCDFVIFACDPKVTARLLSAPLPRALEERYRTLPRFSSYHFAFALDLPTPAFSSDIILDVPESFAPLLKGSKLILREFSHEPSFAPPGKSLLQAMVFVDERTAAGFIEDRRASEEFYKKKKDKLRKIAEKLILSRFPNLSGKLRCIDSWTPATYERYLHSDSGAYMSFILPRAYLPRVCASKINGIDNILLATQWQNVPGGLPIAAERGVSAAKRIGKNAGFSKD